MAEPFEVRVRALWPVEGFPYLVAYVTSPGIVDVWRVLHQHRDLPPNLIRGRQ